MARQKRFFNKRNWVQLALLGVWLNPLLALTRVCGPVYHCHACPLSAFACPIGVMANFSAWHVFPFAVVGGLLAVAAAIGALLCGWGCPFGLLQDVLAKVPVPKFRIPRWTGYGRFAVLAGLVIAAPFWLGKESSLFICSLCPVATLEAAMPDVVQTGNWPSVPRLIVFGLVMVAIFFSSRPWCRALCPLGGILALGNRWSLLRLKWDKEKCTLCGKCERDCPYGVKLPEKLNSAQCLRCLDCTAEKCGAINWSLRGSGRQEGAPPEATAPPA